MRIQPDSTVTLYGGVDIDMTSGVQIVFSSIANQRAYFASKLVQSTVNCTTIKKTGALRLEVAGSVVKNCNYLSFVNPSFDNKVWYARITDYNYINNECTEISYLIDFWQTFMFDVDFEPCGIQRQYLNETDYAKAVANPYDPSIYAFQTPEPLEVDKSLEPYSYEYKMSQAHGQTDGEYLVMSNEMATDGDALTAIGFNGGVSYCCLIAPIDFDDLGTDAQADWTSFRNDVLEAGGRYVAPNSQYVTRYDGTQYVDDELFWSKMPHPYYVVVFPVYSKDRQDAEYNINRLLTLLTRWNAVSQIIGMYALPTYFMDSLGSTISAYGTDEKVTLHTQEYLSGTSHIGYEPHCQKLYKAPFSYMRVENGEGGTKEYQYEKFAEVRDGNSQSFSMQYKTLVNGTLTAILMPYMYGRSVDVPTSSADAYQASNFNFDERIEITDFPQIAFNTDGFLTYLSNSYMSVISGNSSTRQAVRDAEAFARETAVDVAGANMASGIFNAAGSLTSGVAGMLNPTGGGLGQAIGSATGVVSALGNVRGMRANAVMTDVGYYASSGAETEMLDEASRFLGGNRAPDDSARFKDTKAAFANDNYFPGTNGSNRFSTYNSWIDFKVTHVRLRDEIAQKYDLYFKTYGYNFGATVDTPYVLKYVKGLTGNANLPHWEQVNSKDSTYVRTLDAHVNHSMLPVSVAIEGMLNAGVRFLKGESLTPSNNR